MTGKTLLYLMIMRIPGLRPVDTLRLGNKFDDDGDFSVLSKKDIEAFIGRPFKEDWTMENIRVLAERDYAAAQRLGIGTVITDDAEYPPLLREIYDSPVMLFYRGMLPDPEIPLAAIVGTRQPTQAAAALAVKLGYEFGINGIPVISGLALGIDTFSHRGNLDAGAKAVAVLGSGLDQIYPSSNRGLAKRILDNGGVLLSEYPPEMGPRKWHFPARNRIISAMARGTVIVEAPEKSGALITAGFALEQNRDLWVTSVGVNSPKGKGTAKLADDGAGVIESATEILAEWGIPAVTPAEKNIPVTAAAGTDLASAAARRLKISNF